MALIISMGGVSEAQFFRQPDYFLYASNSERKVFDITSDGNIAVALEDPSSDAQVALLKSFNPVTGAVFDSASFGFGPLEVQLAPTANGLHVFVLTSEGGPRRLYLFNMDADGKFTSLGSTQLTTSGTDLGSNLVVSLSGQFGAVMVAEDSGTGTTGINLVTFSLSDGSILSRLTVSQIMLSDLRMGLAEKDGTRTLVFPQNLGTVGLIDVSDPSNPANLDAVLYAAGTIPGDVWATGVAFTNDNRYAFVDTASPAVAIVDLQTRQLVATLSGTCQFGRIAVYDDGTQRLLLLPCTDQNLILLADTSDLTHPTVVNQYSLAAGEQFFFPAFSNNPKNAIVQTSLRILVLNVPDLTEVWEVPVPGTQPFFGEVSHEIMIFGQPQRIFAAWGTADSLFASFPVKKTRRGQLTSN